MNLDRLLETIHSSREATRMMRSGIREIAGLRAQGVDSLRSGDSETAYKLKLKEMGVARRTRHNVIGFLWRVNNIPRDQWDK